MKKGKLYLGCSYYCDGADESAPRQRATVCLTGDAQKLSSLTVNQKYNAAQNALMRDLGQQVFVQDLWTEKVREIELKF